MRRGAKVTVGLVAAVCVALGGGFTFLRLQKKTTTTEVVDRVVDFYGPWVKLPETEVPKDSPFVELRFKKGRDNSGLAFASCENVSSIPGSPGGTTWTEIPVKSFVDLLGPEAGAGIPIGEWEMTSMKADRRHRYFIEVRQHLQRVFGHRITKVEGSPARTETFVRIQPQVANAVQNYQMQWVSIPA
jgi:hypothetical protein